MMSICPKIIFILAGVFVVQLASAKEANDCWYYPKQGADEIHESACLMTSKAKESSADRMVSKTVFKALLGKTDEFASIRDSNGLSYVNSAGIVRSAMTFDNGADPFVEGLARTQEKAKIGYFDTTLNMVIPPAYDFGFPFQNGLAVVRSGCVEQTDGEHRTRVGGLWGAIDKQGKFKYELRYSSEAIWKLLDGKTQ